MLTQELLHALPKTDLHVHLDGSLRIESLIEMARERGVNLPSNSPDGLRELVFKPTYSSLSEYLAGFALTGAVLQDPESLERSAYELALDNLEENVCYIEVRFAPQLHMSPKMSMERVVRAVASGLERAQREHANKPEVLDGTLPPFHFGLILCAMRMFEPGFSAWFSDFCAALGESKPNTLYAEAAEQLARGAVRLRDAGLPIVAFDLAGHEAGHPAVHYKPAFLHAHRHFLARTIHAGEAYGPESIYQAIAECHADRIGHGYHLFSPEAVADPSVADPQAYCEDLAQYLADRRTTIEVCITSNMQTNPSIGDVRDHAFRKMLDHKLSATLCTDNRLVSHTTVTREYGIAVQAFDMTPNQLKNTVVYGFKRSFFPGAYREKRAYVRQCMARYETVFAAHEAAQVQD
ncbi:MAG: adenosine deaminase [Cognaticolwellia sp.]|jgi:adenosine deaminase